MMRCDSCNREIRKGEDPGTWTWDEDYDDDDTWAWVTCPECFDRENPPPKPPLAPGKFRRMDRQRHINIFNGRETISVPDVPGMVEMIVYMAQEGTWQ